MIHVLLDILSIDLATKNEFETNITMIHVSLDVLSIVLATKLE